jgi:DNA invertase Pin-like site-specific DNA recombinase
MVAAWSVDRLGRSLTDLLEFLKDLHAKRVDLFLHQQGLDTSTPSGRAMFQMMGVFAKFERAMIRERVLAGIARHGRKAERSGASALRKPMQLRSPQFGRPAQKAWGCAGSPPIFTLVSVRF